LLEVVDICF